jgi:glutathione S-transferase
MMTLYDSVDSGNSYKVRLLLGQLGLAYRLVACDILKGETRTPQFLQKNPNGRVPILELEDGTYLAESDAILWYLAEGTKFAPATRLERAQTLQWMFFEQYSHEPFIAVVRFWKHFVSKLSPLQELDLPNRTKGGYAALGVMEQHLARHSFFVGGRYGLADIALYGYTHVAPEGGFNLDNFPHVSSWLARVADQPDHVTIDHKN